MTNRRHPVKQLPKSPAPAKRSLATFKANHDPATVNPNKIRAALDRMKAEQGPEAYAYEQTDPEGGVPFMRLAGVGTVLLGQYREQFAGHIVTIKDQTGMRRPARRVWFATVAAATKARGGPAKPDDLG